MASEVPPQHLLLTPVLSIETGDSLQGAEQEVLLLLAGVVPPPTSQGTLCHGTGVSVSGTFSQIETSQAVTVELHLFQLTI